MSQNKREDFAKATDALVRELEETPDGPYGERVGNLSAVLAGIAAALSDRTLGGACLSELTDYHYGPESPYREDFKRGVHLVRDM